ncbi:hypothetical protein [Micromonospora ureilytica]|uniref:hypothetical protein n=1 Tax=Micromonospora ureilytica TaxID=709868 RepID=UPI004039A031
MDRKHVEEWLATYERLWRTPGTDALVTLFTEDASYQQGPYWTPVVGLPAVLAGTAAGRFARRLLT